MLGTEDSDLRYHTPSKKEFSVGPLWNHQKQAIVNARPLPWYALHFEPGTGKTRTLLEILRELFNEAKCIKRTLIFAPAIVVGNWREEWAKFTKIDLKKVVLLQGSQVKRVKDFNRHAWNAEGVPQGLIFVTNYEAVEMKELYALMLKWQAQVMVFDESHRLKNPTSKRSKLVDALANPKTGGPEKRYELTGTAVLNSPLDLFMQFKILMGGFPLADYFITRRPEFLVRNFYQFRTLFFEDKNASFKSRENYFPNWQLKERSSHDLSQILRNYALGVQKSQCLDLPPEQHINIKVGLSTKQAEDYLAMSQSGVVLSEGQAFTADLALTQTMRLMQICSGFLTGRDLLNIEEECPQIKREYEDTPRDDALIDLLDQICVQAGKKVLVWAVWKHNYESIKKACEKLGIKYVEVNGSITGEQKERARKAFISDPTIQVWIGHPGAGGIGVNLVVAPYTIWYSRSYSLEQYEQASARNYRGGQTEPVTHYHLVAGNTIEEEVIEALVTKQTMAEKIARFTRFVKNNIKT